MTTAIHPLFYCMSTRAYPSLSRPQSGTNPFPSLQFPSPQSVASLSSSSSWSTEMNFPFAGHNSLSDRSNGWCRPGEQMSGRISRATTAARVPQSVSQPISFLGLYSEDGDNDNDNDMTQCPALDQENPTNYVGQLLSTNQHQQQ